MHTKVPALVVLLTAVAALVGSAAWALGRSDDGWGMHSFGNGMGYASSGDGSPVRDLRAARQQASRFADRLGLEVGEVMRFSNDYYVELEEDGRPATEVLVDPDSGSIQLEFGPAMMWNTRFGMMGNVGMMGRRAMTGGGGPMMGAAGAAMMGAGFADPSWAPRADGDVSAGEARAIVRRWLASTGEDLEAGDPAQFPGYYTLHILRAGRPAGMISVNAVTGAPWYHGWHGRFISMSR